MSNKKLQSLISLQKWKLWALGVAFTIAGVCYLLPEWLASMFGMTNFIINLYGVLITFLAFLGGVLLIRCPQCRLSLAWYSLTNQSAGTWLFWLTEVTECPRCQFSHKQKQASVARNCW